MEESRLSAFRKYRLTPVEVHSIQSVLLRALTFNEALK